MERGRRQTAFSIADDVANGLAPLRDALKWHLTYNHRPPIHEAWVDSCAAIIQRYNAGDHDLSYQVKRPAEDDCHGLI